MDFVMKIFGTVSKPCLWTVSAAAVAALMSIFVSCSPQVYGIALEMRHPSSSGLDLTGKSVAIFYPSGLYGKEKQLTASAAAALADRLDAAYPESDSTRLYTVACTDGFSSMSAPDSLVNLVLRTDADVVFLFGRPEKFAKGYVTGDFTLPLWCYDALGGDDGGVKPFSVRAYAREDASASGETIGERISSSFVPTWREEEFGIWYRDSAAWIEALQKAVDLKWDDAIKDWMAILAKTSEPYYRSCLEYNIGLGCFMMGANGLARQWLTQSAAEYQNSLTTALLKRLP